MHHVAITTPDLDALITFYCDALGFSLIAVAGQERLPGKDETSRPECAAPLREALLRCGETYLQLSECSAPRLESGAADTRCCAFGLSHICLDVTDLDTEYVRLQRRGMALHSPPRQIVEGVRSAFGNDPDGNLIQLQEVDSPDHPIGLGNV